MPDLEDKLGDIKSLGYKVKLDSNGSRPHHPEESRFWSTKALWITWRWILKTRR
jgi:hypothetical protein